MIGVAITGAQQTGYRTYVLGKLCFEPSYRPKLQTMMLQLLFDHQCIFLAGPETD